MAKVNLGQILGGAGTVLEGIFSPHPANPTAAATPPPSPGGGGDTPTATGVNKVWTWILIGGGLLLGGFLLFKLLKR